MTEEEKAIEILKRDINTPLYGGDTIIVLIEDIEIVLNLIEKQAKEITFQKEINNIEKKRHTQTEKTLKGQIKNKDKEIERLKNLLKENEIYRKNLFNYSEKQNKVIDLMAEYLADIDFDECCAEIPEPCLSCSWEDYEPHTDCIKEYFIKKVEEK